MQIGNRELDTTGNCRLNVDRNLACEVLRPFSSLTSTAGDVGGSVRSWTRRALKYLLGDRQPAAAVVSTSAVSGVDVDRARV